jgi:hypothetical protein
MVSEALAEECGRATPDVDKIKELCMGQGIPSELRGKIWQASRNPRGPHGCLERWRRMRREGRVLVGLKHPRDCKIHQQRLWH